jgi:hypothetical protein
MPAARSGGLYVGDAVLAVNGIDLQEAKHNEAVKILSTVHGEITLEVLYVAPDDSSDEDEDDWEDDEAKRFVCLKHQKYTIYHTPFIIQNKTKQNVLFFPLISHLSQ